MRLFQIEEPDGAPVDPSAPGAAIGIDATGVEAQVGFSVGGNAVVLSDREGFERALPVPAIPNARAEWQEMFEMAKVRAERALARPVTHAVIVLAKPVTADTAESLSAAAAQIGVALLQIASRAELPVGSQPALAAAILAEDLAPRPS
jgi:hypothetical protein